MQLVFTEIRQATPFEIRLCFEQNIFYRDFNPEYVVSFCYLQALYLSIFVWKCLFILCVCLLFFCMLVFVLLSAFMSLMIRVLLFAQFHIRHTIKAIFESFL